MEDKEPSEIKTVSRRNLLRGTLALALGNLLAACGVKATDQPTSLSPPSEATPTPMPKPELLSESEKQLVKENISAGQLLRKAEIIDLNVRPGIDLKYEESGQVAKIRAIADPQKRILQAIGYLDVLAGKRYNLEGDWNCNIYATDLLILLLGNQAIGSLYYKDSGTPTVFDSDNPPPDGTYLFFNSNNFDEWLQKHGQRYGWEMATTQAELKEKLRGDYIALAVTPFEDLVTQGGKIEIGHALVVFGLGDNLLISQATHNIQAKPMPFDHPKVNPEEQEVDPETGGIKRYHFWVHRLPNPNQPN